MQPFCWANMRLPIEESCLPWETTRTKKGVKKNKRKQIKQTLSATPTGSYNKRPAARPSNQRKKVGIQKFDEDIEKNFFNEQLSDDGDQWTYPYFICDKNSWIISFVQTISNKNGR